MPTKKEMRKLRRDQLLEMLIEQTKRKDELEVLLAEAEKKLKDREVVLQEAGTMAEAALGLNAVFEAADSAATQYLENVRLLFERQKAATEQAEATTQAKCDALEAAAWKHCETMEAQARGKCEAMEAKSQDKCRAMEAEVQQRCETLEAETRKKCRAMMLRCMEDRAAYNAWLASRGQGETREEKP